MEEKKERIRSWVFTLNNPEITAEGLEEVLKNRGAVYYVFQAERGEKGTTHFQGYVFFKNGKTFKSVQKIIPKAHLEAARGTPIEASNYCKKEDTRIAGPWEWGDIPQAGKRTDLSKALQDIKDGRELQAIIEEQPALLRITRCLETYKDMVFNKPRDFKTEVWVLIDEPGAGKSLSITEWAKENNLSLYRKSGSSKWWGGYEGQDVVVWDNFRWRDDYFKDGTREHLLEIMDRYATTVEPKGRQVQFRSRLLVFTAVEYPFPRGDMEFDRRINYVEDRGYIRKRNRSQDEVKPDVSAKKQRYDDYFKDPETSDDP